MQVPFTVIVRGGLFLMQKRTENSFRYVSPFVSIEAKETKRPATGSARGPEQGGIAADP